MLIELRLMLTFTRFSSVILETVGTKRYQFANWWAFLFFFFQTPKDKLQCVLRCSSTIMNLLSMASDRSVPAADDFMPVLIKSGVTLLLSNVQFVRDFYEKRLVGEEQYWWMQFVSAIEFIKTMDYAD